MTERVSTTEILRLIEVHDLAARECRMIHCECGECDPWRDLLDARREIEHLMGVCGDPRDKHRIAELEAQRSLAVARAEDEILQKVELEHRIAELERERNEAKPVLEAARRMVAADEGSDHAQYSFDEHAAYLDLIATMRAFDAARAAEEEK